MSKDKPTSIRHCDKPAIQSQIQKLLQEAKLENVVDHIDYSSFATECRGEFEGLTPIGGLFDNLPFPEISMRYRVEYAIRKDKGVCVDKLSSPESAGSSSRCYKS